MSAEIALTLAILGVAVVLFVTEKIRVDLIALLVLGGLVIAGLVTPEQAVSGFSNPAVVTVWAVFILSGGLTRTGIANLLGRQVLRLAGEGEARLLVVIMLTSGVLSAFMNNIGVAAMLLPVVLDISRQTRRAPSKLLLPLAFGSLLGGMLTLIGTPPNILISDALRDAGLRPFGFFDFTPAALVILLAGVAYMVLWGRRLLPDRNPAAVVTGRRDNGADPYELEESLAFLTLPLDSPLAGKTLAESRIGQALGLNILRLSRGGRREMAPQPDTTLQGGDRLLVLGRRDRLRALGERPLLVLEDHQIAVQKLLSSQVSLAELVIAPDSPFVGQTVAQVDVRRRYGLNVLAIRRNGRSYRTNLKDMPVEAGDRVLLQGTREQLAALRLLPDGDEGEELPAAAYDLPARLLSVRVPEGSFLDGQTLLESELGRMFGLVALGLMRDGTLQLMPEPDSRLAAGDLLLVEGHPRDLDVVRGLQTLQVDNNPDVDLTRLQTGPVGLVEVVLSPFTTLADKTLRELRFREKYGLNVLAIWRGGRPYRTNLANMALKLGDALLLYGPREKVNLLGQEPDFIVLREEAQEPPRQERALVAGLVMAGVVGCVLLDWLPIAIAAIVGATVMILTGCLTMDEAYRYIEWKAVFLIAGMLPLGIAMDQSGTARFLAEVMMAAIGDWGATAVLAGLFLLTMLATVFMPNPVVAVLMAPIALTAAADLGVSPFAFMMGIAFAASASFLSPVGHPANVLVMGPGGYRFSDYLKTGIPLALILLLVSLIVLPLLWPYYP